MSALAEIQIRSKIRYMSEPAIDLDALGRLSVAELIQLVEDLWDFIARETPDESLPLSRELAAELDRRMADVASAREKTYNWDVVKEHHERADARSVMDFRERRVLGGCD